MSSEVSVEEIKRDITALYEKIERCGLSKQDLLIAIQKENDSANELQFYIGEDVRRVKNGGIPSFDIESMKQNIVRCQKNIDLFESTIKKENDNIKTFLYMIQVLEEDLVRPKEIWYDAKTGQVVNGKDN